MNTTALPFFAIVVAISSIQFGAAIAKQLFPITGAIGITALRLMLACAMLMIFWRPWRERLTSKQFKAVSLYGLALGFMNLTFYLAIERIPLGLAVTIEFAGPLAIAIFSSKKKSDLLWALLAATGMLLISPLSSNSAIDVFGVIFAMLAAAFWALYIIMGQNVARIMHEGHATTYGMAMASVFITPVVFFADGYARLSLEILPWAFLVALLSSAIPYSLEMLALKRLPKLTFGVLMSLEPAVASLTGLLVLRETLTPMQIFSITLIIAASLGTTIATARAQRRAI
jgi:inner membrane transporter RhtA